MLGTECRANGLLALLSDDLDFSAVERSGKCHVSRVTDLKTKVGRERGGRAFPSRVLGFTIFIALLIYALLNSKCNMEHNHPAALNDSNTRLPMVKIERLAFSANGRSNHVTIFILYLLLPVFSFSLKLSSLASRKRDSKSL